MHNHALLYRTHNQEVIATVLREAKARYSVAQVVVELFSIDEARALIIEMYKTSDSNMPSGFIVVAQTMLEEAQNALLKALEEPPPGVCVWLFLLPETILLPTLQSRLQTIRVTDQTGSPAVPPAYTQWAALVVPEKLAAIEAHTKNKDTLWIKAVARGCQQHLAVNHRQYPPLVALRLAYASGKVGTRGASNKMLLEEMALLLSSRVKTR